MVDLSLVLDVSSSIGAQWTAVRDASRAFVNAFDANNDRVALATFGNGADVLDMMPSSARLQQDRGGGRRAEHASGRQHQHGGGALSRVG